MNESDNTSLNEPAPAYRAGPSGGLDFDLPDWGGQLSRTARMPMDRWLAYCRSNLPHLRRSPGFAARRQGHGVAAEFTL